MNATQEEWRAVVGFEGKYEVSNFGHVRSLTRDVPCKGNKTRTVKGRLLTPRIGSTGYPLITLPGKMHRNIHQLVLEAFVGTAPVGLVCCHNDGDPTNNHINNLRWDSQSNNIADTVRHRTHRQTRKTHCPKGHPFTPENVYIPPNRTDRNCRICKRIQFLAWQQRQRRRA